MADYEAYYRRYLEPHLGTYRLTDLTVTGIEQMYAKLRQDGGQGSPVSASTVNHAGRVLSKMLADAERQGVIAGNVAARARRPSADRQRESPKVWTPTVLRQFLELAEDSDHYPLFHLVAHTGLRRGEAVGLKWEDIDLPEGFLDVRRTRGEVRGGVVESAPKSTRSRRRVHLDPGTVKVLRSRRLDQNGHRLMIGPG